jgi:hypothetical protein
LRGESGRPETEVDIKEEVEVKIIGRPEMIKNGFSAV